MKTVNLSDKQIDIVITHCEEMIELCDTEQEKQVYRDLITELTK